MTSPTQAERDADLNAVFANKNFRTAEEANAYRAAADAKNAATLAESRTILAANAAAVTSEEQAQIDLAVAQKTDALTIALNVQHQAEITAVTARAETAEKPW